MPLSDCLLDHKPENAVPILPVRQEQYAHWHEQQPDAYRRWLNNSGFGAKTGDYCLIPDSNHTIAAVVITIDRPENPWALAGLSDQLPAGSYFIAGDWSAENLEYAALGWGLGAYRYTRYKESKPAQARLVFDGVLENIRHQIDSIGLVRDLINTPAQDMMPEQLAEAVLEMAEQSGAQTTQIIGDDLLTQNYPVIHAVGRASNHAPRLIDLRWGDATHPKLTLIGKGVCFDSGGLDLKSANGMRLMKKDMGGAAHAIGLAQLVMAHKLPVCLRLLIPAVENAVSGNAFRPGDVIRSRQGISIEVDNTDAEGRLILCDALSEAATENPDLMIDFATLTGAARVAVGTEIGAYFSNNEDAATALNSASVSESDPVWRLPLHRSYRQMLNSKIADIANSASSPYAGAITAALFLQEFVPDQLTWLHFDLMAWNTRARPGQPEGGEAMGLRALFRYLRERYSEE